MAKTAKKKRAPAGPAKAAKTLKPRKPVKGKPVKSKSIKGKPVKGKPLEGKAVEGKAVVRRTTPAPETDASPMVLDRLWAVVMSRRDADPAVSHSARLLSRGTAKVAQKFGEEAVECLIEAVADNRGALIGESADVLYHLLVLWVAAGVRPDEVWSELERREGVSGVAEKASRVRDLPLAFGVTTRKIP